MKQKETPYLTPAPLTEPQLKQVYGPNRQAERQERVAGKTALQSIRKAAKKHGRLEEL